jgi:hypothetical protein
MMADVVVAFAAVSGPQAAQRARRRLGHPDTSNSSRKNASI